MNRKDEIKKMANIITDASDKCVSTGCGACKFKGKSPCGAYSYAAALYAEGYRQVVGRISLAEALDEEQEELKRALIGSDIEAATRRQMAKEILNATTIHGRRYIRKYLKERYGL